MKSLLIPFSFLILMIACGNAVERPVGPSQDYGYVQLAVNLAQQVKDGQSTLEVQQRLSQIAPDKLAEELTTDDLRRTFWINVYNAYVILLLQDEPALYEDRGAFFSEPRFTIAGQELSFDDVEHGILRRSKNKLSLGYLGKVVVPDFEKLFRVDAVDARIHFALNCGAKSCPPVRVYHPNQLNAELDDNARRFLQRVTTLQGEDVETTVLFQWFRNDFNDRGGVTAYLQKYEAIPTTTVDPSIGYTTYDWTLDIDNYTSDYLSSPASGPANR